MNSQTTSQQSFKSDYAVLQLDSHSDWTAARASYRRLVHQWHPDKFVQRPTERAFAQLQFTNLTKSYNSLRNFHRINGRLPLQSLADRENRSACNTEPTDGSQHAPKAEDGIYNSRKVNRKVSGYKADTRAAVLRKKQHTCWIASGAIMMAATIIFFLIQDRNAIKARLELGREVVRQTPPSEFIRNNNKIRKSQTREALLKPPE